MRVITPLNASVRTHEHTQTEKTTNRKRETISSNDSAKKPLQNRHFFDGSKTLCNRQISSSRQTAQNQWSYTSTTYMLSRCAQEQLLPLVFVPFNVLTMSYSGGNMECPARTIHRSVESLLKCTALNSCRSPFRNIAI